MPRRSRTAASPLTALRIAQETEKLRLLRMKVRDQQALKARRRLREEERLAAGAGAENNPPASPWG